MEINSALLHSDLRKFEAALTAFHGQAGRTIDDSIRAIDLLDKNETLGSSEITRRARLLLGQALLSESEAEQIVAAASRWKPAVKLSIQLVLAPEQRQRIYSLNANPASAEQTAFSSVELLVETGKQSLPAELGRPSIIPVGSKHEDEDFKSVILLGSADAHEPNIKLLAKKEFSPIRVSAPDKLESALGSGICGIIVDGSWWAIVPPDDHEACLRRLLSFSNFIWLKIDPTSLQPEVAKQFLKLCRACRFREPLMTEVGFHPQSRLDDFDIQRLTETAGHLRATERIRFHPSEVTEDEAVVLLGAIQKQHAGKNAFLPVEIERVDTSVVQGGQSSAKILLLKPNDNSAPFVAKIDEYKLLNGEMLRFKTFIEQWQPHLRPELYIHNGVAVIFFAMIDDDGDQDKRAPTLFERITSLGFSERFAKAEHCATLEDLQHTITRAIDRLSILNRKQCPATAIPNSCWIKVEALAELRRNNVEFAVHGTEPPIDIVAAAEIARLQVEKLNGRAICHGDVHLRNVLVRLDREPLFIDFAYSGPGHPAFDLVRLEASLLYAHFRMAESEDKMVECFYTIFTTDSTLEKVKNDHPKLLASKTSCLAVQASIETRRAALEVLETYGGNELDYFSMKMIVACQSLIIQGFQEGAARAGIRAISRILKKF